MSQLKKWIIRLVKAFAAILLVLGALIIIVDQLVKTPGEKILAPGVTRNTAQYVVMRDGVKIAVDVWLPSDYEPGQSLPSIMYMTRYWRASQLGILRHVAVGLGLTEDPNLILPVRMFNEKGYAFVKIDARGSGASFGGRQTELRPDEVADYGEIADWIVRQTWSNGRIGALGVSYLGNTAELLTTTQRDAVRVVAPMYSDFDPVYQLIQPGGAKNKYMDNWGEAVGHMDRNETCALLEIKGVLCILSRLWVGGVKPVDADRHGTLLQAAVTGHADNVNVGRLFEGINFSDDPMGIAGSNAWSFMPAGRGQEIEASDIPMFVWAGWYDAATADGALSRFQTFSNPQRVIIGAFSHGGAHDTDPFRDAGSAPDVSPEEQLGMIAAYFDGFLRDGGHAQPEHYIRYYELGSGKWYQSDVWPPAGVTTRTYYPAPDNQLLAEAGEAGGEDRYAVDYSATMGTSTRWHTNFGGGDVIYPNRAGQDKKLLVYQSAPLAEDLHIVGAPVLSLSLRVSHPDPVIFAYLEAVSPEGEVLYITEGELRAIHRKISSEGAPYVQDGPRHSFKRSDSQPVPVDDVVELKIRLASVAAMIPEGWRVRLALSGADSDMFKRWPGDGAVPQWTVYRGGERASRFTLPTIN